jgi:hypothetical protein
LRTEKTLPYSFPIPEEVCLEKGKQRKRKEKRKKDNIGNHNPIDFQISATSSR